MYHLIMPTTDRLKGARQKSLVFGASALPVTIILLLPLIAGWDDIVPAIFEAGQGDGSAAPEIVAELSSDLNAIAIATIVGAAVLLREWRSKTVPTRLWIVTTTIVSTAIASCYAGVRFRFAVAEQIVLVPLDLPLIADRLATQGVLLLASVSALIYMALFTLIGRPSTKRKKPSPAPLPSPEQRGIK